MQFDILDTNWNKFEKKMNTITKRYARMGQSFSYEIIGHEVKDIEIEGRYVSMPVTIVEVNNPINEGRYDFAASVDHLATGNVVRGMGNYSLSVKFVQELKPVCEHCGTDRYRKSTYLVYDKEEDKFLQLGKSCLNEVVGNLSAEGIALYESMYHFCEDCGNYGYNVAKNYIDAKIFMECVVSAQIHFGFATTAAGPQSTRARAFDFYCATLGIGMRVKEIRQEMEDYGIEIEDASKIADEVIEWYRNLEPWNEYLGNLHTILSEDYFDYKYLGIVASAYNAYLRQGEYEKKTKEQEQIDEGEWLGQEGERVDAIINSWKLVTSNDGFYGTSFLYQFITSENQTLNWWTTKYIDKDMDIKTLRGTVKKLDWYKGRKITTLTRCKIN